MIFKSASVFYQGKFSTLDVRVCEGVITEIGSDLTGDTVVDCGGKRLLPGLIDLHSHGCVGFDFSTATPEELEKMCRFYASRGVTSVLATTMTMPKDDYLLACERIASVRRQPQQPNGSYLLGINMEGPFLGANKRGAHDPNLLCGVDEEFFLALDQASEGGIRMVDLDPTLDGALEFITRYADKKVLSLAHTACNYEQACHAFDLGVRHVTHLFNAMNGLHHRDPGIVGAFQEHGAFAEMITDGVHLHPAVVRMMFKLAAEQLVLISDSMSACGLSDGQYVLGGLTVTVADQKATLADGTIAGSTCNLLTMLQRAISFGVPAEKAILSSTYYPAVVLGCEENRGQIAVGAVADLLVMDEQFNLEQVWINGQAI